MKSTKKSNIDAGMASNNLNLFENSSIALSVLTQNLPLAVIIWAEDFEILEWDSKAEKLFGHSKQKAIGQNLSKLLFDENQAPTLKDIWRETSASDNGFQLHALKHRNSDGNVIFCDWNNVSFTTEKGLQVVLSMAQDVTAQVELKYAEQNARLAYKELTENLNNYIYMHDLDGNMLSINEVGARAFGYTTDEFLQLTNRDLIDNEYLQVANEHTQVKLGGKIASAPYTLLARRKDGSPLWIEVSNRLVYKDGEPVAVQGIARDVSERKHFEEELRNSERMFRSIFEAIDDVYYRVNIDGIIDLASPSCFTHLGYTPEEMTGMPAEKLYANIEIRDKILSELKENKAIYDYEIDCRHKDGSVLPFSVTAHGLYDDDGNFIGTEGLGRNLKQRQEIEQQFRKIFATIQDVYYRVEDGLVSFVSPSCLSVFGYTPEEMVGQPSEKFFADNDRQRFLEAIQNNNGAVTDYEVDFLHKNGSDIPCSMNAQFIYDDEGIPVGTEGTVRDISIRKEAEQAIKENEIRFRNIFESIHDVYCRIDNEVISLISPSCESLFGYTPEEMTGMNTEQFYASPEERDNLLKNMSERGCLIDYEVKYKHKDGSIKLCSLNTQYVLDEQGNPIAAQGIIRDITSRKEDEEAVRQSESRLRRIFESLQDVFFRFEDGMVTIISPSCKAQYGYEVDELIDQPAIKFYAHEKDRDHLVDKISKEGSLIDYEVNFKHKDGSIIPSSMNAQFVYNNDGKPVAIEGLVRNISERKTSEFELRNSEERFRNIFETIQDVYFRVEGGLFTMISPSCKDHCGYTVDEIIGKSTDRFYANPEDRNTLLKKLSTEGSIHDYEIDYLHKDGHIVPSSMNVHLVLDERNNPIAIEGTVRDIKARKEAEDAIRENEKRFRRIFESFYDVYYEADLNGIVNILSPSVYDHYGYKPEEIIGNPATMVYAYPEQREGLLALLQKDGLANDYELMLQNKDGKITPTSCSTRIMVDDEGNPTGVQGVLRDISARKESEAEIRENEARFRSIFNSIPDAFLELNNFETISNASPSVWQFGFTQEMLIGHSIKALLDNKDEWRSITQEVHDKGEVIDREIYILSKENIHVPVALTAYLIHDDENNPAGSICILRDITEHKRNEEELQLARDQALEASRAKSAFLANMSHELRTPLNAVIGYSEMLAEDAEESGDDQYIDDLKKIHTSGSHLLSLINDVLDLSKIEAGKMELFNEDVDIGALLKESISTILPQARKNNNQLDYKYPDDIGTINTDMTKLRQALFNLMSNACKFSQDGNISIEVHRSQENGQEWIYFNIKDTGIGIDNDTIDKLFSEFTQADATTTREYGGTGLGLVISKRFCQMMGGDITVESEPGVGSTFTIKLPVNAVAH